MDKKRLKRIQLEILREIKRVCDKNNITYFLNYGTLLGAVRHKGMIPWDDDIDLGMRREDYERFSQIAPMELDDKFYYQSWDNDANYGMPFAKVRRKNTHLIEKASMYSGQNDGVFVDIFPFDHYPAAKRARFMQKIALYAVHKMMLAKCGYVVWTDDKSIKQKAKKAVYKIIKLLSNCFTKERLILLYDKKATRYNGRQTNYYILQGGDGQYEKWIVPHECLESFIELEFEKEQYPCPKEYDSFLKSFYGDYMELPPVEERTSGHDIVEFIIDDLDG